METGTLIRNIIDDDGNICVNLPGLLNKENGIIPDLL